MNENASIIVALCSYLCADSRRPLEPSEWTRLADMMISRGIQPKDIPDLSDENIKQYFGYSETDIDRIKRLLDRSGSLSFELEKLSSMGIKIITRADKGYPKALKAKLKVKLSILLDNFFTKIFEIFLNVKLWWCNFELSIVNP